MESLISTFHIDWKIIIAQTINFGIVFLVLYLFALKPLKKLMSERENKIAQGVDDAKSNAELIRQTKEEYAQVISKAREESHVMFQEGKKEAEIKKTEMLENAKLEVENMISNGKKLLETEKAKIIEEAKKEIVSLVVSATEKILEDKEEISLDEKTIKKISKM